MKSTFILILACLLAGNIWASPAQNNTYQYTLDLVNVQDDKVQVELITPKMDKNKAVFYMPKIVPGTYEISDFGRFISEFKAFDQQGNPLHVEHPEVNTWKISRAKSLYRITYWVDDTYDATGGKPVMGMAGTNIEAGKNFLLNGQGFYGYFKGMEFMPFEVSVKKPEGFAHQSAYEEVRRQGGIDVFTATDYHQLVDMPVMYCQPDTAIVRLGGTDVLIAVYSPNKALTADFLREKYTPLLKSQTQYLGGKLPVNRYAFIMYFMGEPLPIGTGALEHNFSSVYCLPEADKEKMAPFLVDIASHEFFHVITPLNVHSEEIHYFDFNNPDMSRHLWMYEGITEYFSHHNQVRSGMITQEEFLQRMGKKIQNSQSTYQDDLSFTKMSSKVLGKFENQYANVYEKGALIGMCLDIELHRLSKGKYGVVNMMEDLSKHFGSNRPFKDKQLIHEIEKMTYPEVGDFLKKFVQGNTPIPYGQFFDKMGISYTAPKDTMVYSIGDVGLGYNQDSKRLYVADTYNMNEMGHELGYRIGDEFLSIGGVSVPSSGLQEFINTVRNSMKEGDNFSVLVARKDESGQEQQITLNAKTHKSKRVLPPGIELKEDVTDEQLKLRNSWIGKK
ncbi:MAG: hypothetical protein R2830_17000 [Saprospiraceae bacterium]